MEQGKYGAGAIGEHRFWLQILGDHSRFIHDSLAPKEMNEIQTAQHFIQVFDQLLEQSREPLSGKELMQLNSLAYQYAQQLRVFKLNLLSEQLLGKITIHLSPTFINHMVNELDEYLRILTSLVAGEIPPLFHPVHHHLLWLLDASGHAGAIADSLDKVEYQLKLKSGQFEKDFDHFYMKAVEMAGYLRTNLNQFPALSRFNQEVELEMLLFREFLKELEEMDLKAELLGTLTPLMADHMAREECYYLMKLAQVSEVHAPNCDPAKPRVETLVK